MLIQLEEKISDILWTLVLDRDIAAVVLANARERPLFMLVAKCKILKK